MAITNIIYPLGYINEPSIFCSYKVCDMLKIVVQLSNGGNMRFARENNELIVSFDEKMDSARCVQAAKEVEKAISDAKKEVGAGLKVKFDVSVVTYGSSSFLRICLSAAKSVGTTSFVIVGANETLKKVFSIAGFNNIMTIS